MWFVVLAIPINCHTKKIIWFGFIYLSLLVSGVFVIDFVEHITFSTKLPIYVIKLACYTIKLYYLTDNTSKGAVLKTCYITFLSSYTTLSVM